MSIKRIRKIELDGNEKLSVSTDEIAQTVTLSRTEKAIVEGIDKGATAETE
jgi:hypothetical protein